MPQESDRWFPTQSWLQSQHQELSADEAAFSQQLMCLLCSNIRSWVTGIVIHDTWVTLWYADRMGVVVSSRFSCISQPNLLSLAGLAIGATDRKGLGISSFMSFQMPSTDRPVETSMQFNFASFALPSPMDSEGRAIDGVITFGESSWDVPDVATGQLVGRGTAVLPVRATNPAAAHLFGQTRTYVLKMAWALHSAPVEDATVRLIRRRLSEEQPSILAHVTNLKCSVTKTMMEMGLPRASLFVREEPRILRLQLLDRYGPLEAITSVDDFKTCYLDALYGEQSLFLGAAWFIDRLVQRITGCLLRRTFCIKTSAWTTS